MTIYEHVIWDDGSLHVCGSFWPGFRDGAPALDWWPNGGPPTRDNRGRRRPRPDDQPEPEDRP